MKFELAGALVGSMMVFAAAAHAQTAGDAASTNQASPAASDTATAPPAAPATPAAPASPASPAAPKNAGVIQVPTPPDGKGEVVFFRKNSFVGMAVWFNIRENDKLLGKLSNGAYFIQIADPGDHSYTAATENKDTLKIEVDPGEIYYVQGTVAMGVMIGEANIAPSDQATFDKDSKGLKLAAPPPPEKPAADSTNAATH